MAVVIGYAIALHMDWEKPYWTAWTAFSIGLATRGEGLQKGSLRLAGGLVGAISGLVLLAFFIQDRWLFITVLSLYGATFTYLALESRERGYFWQQAGFFATVIAFDSAFDPVNAFAIGVDRAQETGAGLVTYIVVGLLLWPESSRRDLEQTASRLVTGIRQRWSECAALMKDEPGSRESGDSGDQVRSLRAQLGRLLSAAEKDSWEVKEVSASWRSLQAQLGELDGVLSRARTDLDEFRVRNIGRLVPGLPSYIAEIDRRLAGVEDLLAGRTPAHRPAVVALELDDRELASLSQFDRAALTVQHDRLKRVEAVTRSLLESAWDISGLERGGAGADASGAAVSGPAPVGGLVLDRDYVDESLRVAVSIWLLFLAVVYIPDVPAGLGALGIGTRIAFADSEMPSLSVTALFGPVIAGVAGAFPFYFLLLPTLSTFAELAVVLATVAFLAVYVLHEPRQALARTLFAYMFFSIIGLTNEQVYSFSHYATTLMMWLVVLSVLTVAEYIPFSHQPDRVFTRLVTRFFRGCEFLLRLGRTPERDYSLMLRLQAAHHSYEVATLPAKMDRWGRSLPPAALGTSTPEQVQAFVRRLVELSSRIEMLLRARTAHQSETLVRELRPDIRAWRTGVEDILRTLAVEPDSADYQAVQSRLLSLLSHLEARIKEVLDQTDGKVVAAEEFRNMYRLLGAHRGVSESLVRLTRPAAAIDWERLREARF